MHPRGRNSCYSHCAAAPVGHSCAWTAPHGQRPCMTQTRRTVRTPSESSDRHSSRFSKAWPVKVKLWLRKHWHWPGFTVSLRPQSRWLLPSGCRQVTCIGSGAGCSGETQQWTFCIAPCPQQPTRGDYVQRASLSGVYMCAFATYLANGVPFDHSFDDRAFFVYFVQYMLRCLLCVEQCHHGDF